VVALSDLIVDTVPCPPPMVHHPQAHELRGPRSPEFNPPSSTFSLFSRLLFLLMLLLQPPDLPGLPHQRSPTREEQSFEYVSHHQIQHQGYNHLVLYPACDPAHDIVISEHTVESAYLTDMPRWMTGFCEVIFGVR
jgi:hypothetical protein